MNTGRFLSFLELLLEREKIYAIQDALSQVNNAIRTLTDQPQNAEMQSALSKNLLTLERAVAGLSLSLTPAQVDLLSEIEGGDMLSPLLSSWIKQWITVNGMTPAVARDQISSLTKKRSQLLAAITEAVERLKKLGVKPEQPPIGQVELGFLIPRALFDNDFDQFRKELAFLSRMARFYSEAATGHIEEVTIGEISSTDPLLFLGLSVSTVLAISGTVKWLLDSFKTTLEIREILERSKQAKVAPALLDGFTTEINDRLDRAVQTRVQQLLENVPNNDRKNEIAQGLEVATRGLLARIERGMKVEIKLSHIPPETVEVQDMEKASEFAQVDAISQELVFPRVSGEALVQLEQHPESHVERDDEG